MWLLLDREGSVSVVHVITVWEREKVLSVLSMWLLWDRGGSVSVVHVIAVRQRHFCQCCPCDYCETEKVLSVLSCDCSETETVLSVLSMWLLWEREGSVSVVHVITVRQRRFCQCCHVIAVRQRQFCQCCPCDYCETEKVLSVLSMWLQWDRESFVSVVHVITVIQRRFWHCCFCISVIQRRFCQCCPCDYSDTEKFLTLLFLYFNETEKVLSVLSMWLQWYREGSDTVSVFQWYRESSVSVVHVITVIQRSFWHCCFCISVIQRRFC